MQALSRLLKGKRRVNEIRIGEIQLNNDQIDFTHPTVMSLHQSLQDAYIPTKDSPLTKVSSLASLPKLKIYYQNVIPKIERIPKFFKNFALLQKLHFEKLYDSDLEMILDTCQMLNEIRILTLEEHRGFVYVNLDMLQELESIHIGSYSSKYSRN